jgi:hypothetical protein
MNTKNIERVKLARSLIEKDLLDRLRLDHEPDEEERSICDAAANAARKQRGRPFPKGVSGNPRGKRKGQRHYISRLPLDLMGDDCEAVVQKVMACAKEGDMQAARLILDRIVPVRRGAPVLFDLPDMGSPADILRALAAMLKDAASGILSPEEASAVAAVLEGQRKAYETIALEQRVARLEQTDASE